MNHYTKNLPPARHYDVIVVGSGSAGATAAIASARAGANTLVIGRLPFLGGTSTAVTILHMPCHSREPQTSCPRRKSNELW